MSSAGERDSRPLVYGLRIGAWYATLFVAGSLAIVYLTYVLTSASLAQRDRQIIDSKLGAYAAAYDRGGLDGLAATVQAEQQTAPERLFVRVVDRGAEAIVLSQPQGWDLASLETGSLRLADGTLVQVGKSTEARDDLLSRFRAALGLVTLSIVVIALTGGALATQSALKPIRQLIAAVQRIIRTGRTDARVPLAGTPRRDRRADGALQRHARQDRRARHRHARRARQRLARSAHADDAPARHRRRWRWPSPPDLDRYREALADCVEEADRVLVMLTTLMDISEAESGAMPLQREPVALADIVARAVGPLSRHGRREGRHARPRASRAT